MTITTATPPVVASLLGQQAADLCLALIDAEAGCFKPWCDLVDGPKRLDPDAVVATQDPVHEVAEVLRRVCLADAATADTARRALLRTQVEGAQRAEEAVRAERGKPAREAIRRQWATDCCRIFFLRDALSVGLGWPHRGERVTATFHDPEAERDFTRDGIYSTSYDTHNVTHLVWFPGLSWDRHVATRIVAWEPALGRWESADPAGDIAMRVTAAPGRRLPVPLLRWPEPKDVGLTDLPPVVTAKQRAAEQAAAKAARRGVQLSLFGGAL